MIAALQFIILWEHKVPVIHLQTEQPWSLPRFRQNDAIPFRVRCIQRDVSSPGRYSLLNIENLSLEIVFTDATGATVLSSLTTFTKDSTAQSFEGVLNLSSAALTSALSGATELSALLGMRLIEPGGGITTILESVVTIYPALIPSTVLEPTGGLIPLSLQEALAMFVPYILPNGRSITIPSATGATKAVLRVTDSDGFQADN